MMYDVMCYAKMNSILLHEYSLSFLPGFDTNFEVSTKNDNSDDVENFTKFGVFPKILMRNHTFFKNGPNI